MARIPMYQSQVGIRAGGGSLINTPTESTDNQMLQQGVNGLANAVAKFQMQKEDASLQDASLDGRGVMQAIISNSQQQQGKNAIGISQRSLEAFDQEIGKISPPVGRAEDWGRQVKAMRLQLAGMTSNYEIQQTEQYHAQQVSAMEDLGVEGAGQAYNDPVAYNLNNASVVHSIRSHAESQGWSDEQTNARIQAYMQRASQARAGNYATANPQGWLNGDMPQSDSGSLDMAAIAIVESSDRHTNSDGSIVTSTAGAQGRYQLMPSTGQELAAKRGVAYDPSNESQHAELASDYARELSGKYGSELLAGAAYNWGQGKVDSLIQRVGDPRKGEVSEAEFVSQLPQETQGWLSRYRKNKTGLDPVSMHKIDSIATSQINAQRSAYRQQLEPQVINTLAQYNDGNVPDYVPSKSEIVRAYGADAPAMIKKIDVAASNALLFNQIQYSSPEEQMAALQSAKPQVNDPDYATKLDSYGKLTALVKRSNEQIVIQQNTQAFNAAMTTGQKLDPNNKAMQTAADGTLATRNFVVSDPATHDAVVQQIALTGILPAKVESQLTAVARSRSPDAVKQGADLFNRMYETDMSSVGNMPKDMQGFYLTIQQLTSSGMDSSLAIEQAQNATFNQSDALKAQLASTQSTSSYKKDRTKATEDAVSSMSQWFRIDPSSSDETPEAVKFRNDYNSLYDVNYRLSGGSAEVAKKMTNQQITANWAISEVNGNAAFMKYAPEVMARGGPPGWQADQWKEEKSVLMYGDGSGTKTVSAASLGITSGRGSFLQGSDRKARIDGDLEVTSDVLTPSNGDYAIIVKSKDKNGLETVRPLYDDDGRAMRWKPSLQEWKPYQDMQKESLQEQQDQITRGESIRALKDKRRALDEQYRQFHEERVDKLKDYFSWSK